MPHLTATQVKNARTGTLSDGGGLILVHRNGSGSWVYRYTYLGKRRDMGLGSKSVLSLADARKARDKWAAVLAGGRDPITAREAERAAARGTADPLLSDMIQTVFEARKAKLRGDGARGRWLSPLNLYVTPKIGQLRMSQITAADIHKALSPIWRTMHPTAQKCIERLHIVFRAARLMGMPCDPFTVDQARAMLGDVRHQTRHITATPWQDVPDLYAALVARGPLASALALRWAILTMVRSHAVRGARFDEIDGDVWTVPADRVKAKEGQARDFRVPLTAEALAVADLAGKYSATFMFPGHRGNHITDVATGKELKASGFVGTMHGFRTSFRTWVQDTEACSFDVAETVLGHQIGGKVERSYARSDLLDPRRRVMEAWARHVTGAGATVIRLRV